MATHLDSHQSLRRIRFSFADTYMGRQLHPSGRHGNTVRTRSLIWQDVEKNCNRSDIRATLSRRQGNIVRKLSLLWKLRVAELQPVRTLGQHHLDAALIWKCVEVCYEKPVAQKTVQTLDAFVRRLPREIRDRLYFGLLSL
jgi:hypothetical protein